jgi:EpsI family protein
MTTDSWMPQFHGAVTRKQVYQKEGRSVWLYVGSYATQTQGRELISDLNSIADRSEWRLQYAHGRVIEDGARRLLEQRMTSASGEQRLVWYWYRVAGVSTTSRYMAKLLQVYGFLLGQPEASLFAVAIEVEDDVQEARQWLRDFISIFEPSL